jgi:hypothetical protein
MTSKKRARYEIKEKEKIINELDKNLHVKGPNVGKPNFYLVAMVLFGTLKKLYHPKWNDWFLNAPKEMTSHGKKNGLNLL